MDLAIQNFRGIRKVNPVVDVVSGVVLSAVTCRNTGLWDTAKGYRRPVCHRRRLPI